MTNRPSIQGVIDELLDPARQTISEASLYEFSDMDPASLQILLEAWPRIAPERKRRLLEQLQDLSDEDTLVSFDEVARALLNDADAQIRARAIRLLDEYDDVKLVPLFINILAHDADAAARAQAAASLGKYVELGELEEISQTVLHQVEEALLEKVNSDDHIAVRCSALEALGYSSRSEVVTLIESAFHRQNPDWQASALLAMGRSADERWQEAVLQALENDHPGIQLAAVQAAGELRLGAARPLLFDILEEGENTEILAAAIWSLSQIGGEEVLVLLESLLDEAQDRELIEFLEDALDNLAFTEDLNRFDLMRYDSEDEE